MVCGAEEQCQMTRVRMHGIFAGRWGDTNIPLLTCHVFQTGGRQLVAYDSIMEFHCTHEALSVSNTMNNLIIIIYYKLITILIMMRIIITRRISITTKITNQLILLIFIIFSHSVLKSPLRNSPKKKYPLRN